MTAPLPREEARPAAGEHGSAPAQKRPCPRFCRPFDKRAAPQKSILLRPLRLVGHTPPVFGTKYQFPCFSPQHQEQPAMASEKNLQGLFHETLKDIYFAEKKILSALPKLAKAAQSQELKAAFEKHESETEEHVARLEEVFEEIDEKPRGKTCDAIMGIIEEGQEVMKEFKGAPALDAGLLAAAQAVEHYEIARYGTLKTWAAELGLNQAVNLLERTLAEEKKTDETLTKLAESEVNQHAQAA
jgi:ferritin-like metal-binding protein YciE